MFSWEKVLKSGKQELLQKLTTRLTLAEERTRRDIANTLHDGVGFEMVTMLNSLRSLREKTEGRDAKELLADNISRMEKLIENTRSFTFEISPPLLYEAGLDATLEACCGHMFGTNGVKCDSVRRGPRSASRRIRRCSSIRWRMRYS